MVLVLISIFIVGYTCIALEHPLKVNKTATALLLGTALWAVFSFCNIIFRPDLDIEQWRTFISGNLIENLGETAEIVFFLLGAMTIVTLVEDYQGFRIITDKITTTNKKKLLWELSILTFFLSALLDNMTTAIVMCALLSKLIADKKERWLFAGMVILAANAGGAWSPIGDVTTIMLWIGGQVTTINIMVKTLVASFVCMAVPVLIVGGTLKGDITRPESESRGVEVPVHLRRLILIMGVAALIFVPIFKTITHLPPYLGMLFGLGVLWVTTEIVSRKYEKEGHKLPTAVSTLEHIDVPTILFFLGILMAVACLKVAGILGDLAGGLNDAFLNISMGDEPVGFFLIDLIIGVFSSVVDNVPLVAAVMGMYPITDGALFAVNHPFWEFLAYCAGTGGSLLIIGSAAGVAVMGMEKIDFIWYLKNITLKALVGYLAGALVFVLMDITLFEKVEWLRNLA
ncbi:MAG: sodium:proton antiporter NhaD [Bacteroidales bacterium]|nr:sodium:proton antiporter NhaD [Bacteroidales bacterium]MBR3413390.1 sodium:proton antiporter NhaD [Bacteroidales bacterium]